MDNDSNRGQRYSSKRLSQLQLQNVATRYLSTIKWRVPRKIKQRFWLLMGFLALLILACIGSVVSLALYTNTLIPNPTSQSSVQTHRVQKATDTTQVTHSTTLTDQDIKDARNVVTWFYTRLKAKDYKDASTYFDSVGTIEVNGEFQKVSPASLQSLDESLGPIQKFTIIEATPSSNINEVLLSVKITRENVTQQVKLTTDLENDTWKITSTINI